MACSWHRIFSKQRGIALNWLFRRLLALSGAANRANRLVHAPIRCLLLIVCESYKLCGGEGGIRTLGTGYPVRQISNLVPSTTRPPLRGLEEGPGELNNYALIG
jgi:hypothetical protein